MLSGRTDTPTRTPRTKATDGCARDALESLEAFRTATVLHRPDGQYAAKAARSATIEPTKLDWMRMTRLADSLTAQDELEWLYHAQDVPEKCVLTRSRQVRKRGETRPKQLNGSDSIQSSSAAQPNVSSRRDCAVRHMSCSSRRIERSTVAD